MSHRREITTGIAVLCPVSAVAEAVEAVRAGAQIVDADDEALVTAIQETDVDALVCGPGAAADLGRDLAIARRAVRRLLVCEDVASADRAVQAGITRDRVVIEVTAGELAAAARAGWRTMVDVDAGLTGRPSGEAVARAGAAAAVSAWLGASVIRTRYVAEIRRCLDMTESITGRRPPAWAVRGLA